MKFLIAFIVLVIALPQISSASIIVSQVRGTVSLDGRKESLKGGEKLESDQVLLGKDQQSRVQLNWDSGRAVLLGKFKLKLQTLNQKTKEPSSLNLLYGKIRAQTKARDKSDPLKIITPVSVAGVRGTDFTVSYEENLKESEIVCFESHVEFTNSETKKSIVVGPGQWGGLGLRFGELRDPLDLPPDVLKFMDKSTEYLAP
jgi:hypothetical protein